MPNDKCVRLRCPKCGDPADIWRCQSCRESAAGYACDACGFEGP